MTLWIKRIHNVCKECSGQRLEFKGDVVWNPNLGRYFAQHCHEEDAYCVDCEGNVDYSETVYKGPEEDYPAWLVANNIRPETFREIQQQNLGPLPRGDYNG